MTQLDGSIPEILQSLQPEGWALLSEPMDVSDEKAAGGIDAVAADDRGRVWLLGWTRAGIGNAFGAAILDGESHGCSIVMARYAREELADGASGFIGLVQGGWRPDASTGKIHLVLATEGRPHLRSSGDRLRRTDMRNMSMIVDAVRGATLGGHFNDLRALMLGQDGWSAPAAGRDAGQIELGLDNVVAIPGVGCLVEGWVISPTRQVTGFTLRAGSTISRADPRCSFRRPRHDLGPIMQRHAELADEAGFVAFFPVADSAELTQGLTLKVHQGERIDSNLGILERDVRWLHRGAGEQVLLRLYPALQHEPFFPAMAAMIRRIGLTHRATPVAWRLAEMPAGLFMAIPDSRSELYRSFDQLALWAPMLQARDIGVTLMASDRIRSEALSLYAEAGGQLAGREGGLCFLSGPARPRDVVQVLAGSGCERAVILREGFRLAPEALQLALDRLALVQDDGPETLVLDGELPALSRGEGAPVQLWTTAGLHAANVRPMAWADLPGGRVIGHAARSVARQPRRPMIAKLEAAGVWT